MFRGIATLSYWADDVAAAARWYTDLLQVEPYFVRPEEGPPGYVEFRLGDRQDELGIVDRRFAPPGLGSAGDAQTGGVVAYWHVDDIEATLARMIEMSARPAEPLTEREAGFRTASVIDPFGNVVGLMHNPHYLEMLG